MRVLFSLVFLLVVVATADAGPRSRGRSVGFQTAQSACPGGVCSFTTTPSFIQTSETAGVIQVAKSAQASDALDAVNAKRAGRGLAPYLRDEGLTAAAQSCAEHRASRRLFGHTSNDFQFLPPGASASAAGCAAYPAEYGWMSCCVYDSYRYAGAASVVGPDGRTYHHIFVR